MYQEKLRAMCLNNIGTLSSGNRTKQIHVRYFMIKDIIAMRYLKVKYCSAGKILALRLTKKLEGTEFHKIQAEIQGILEDTQIHNWAETDLKTRSSKAPRRVLKEVT